MDFKNIIFGFVFLTIIFIAFNLAFNTPSKTYIPQENLDELENLGRQYVSEAKPDPITQVFFYISSFLTILKTTFNFITLGVANIVYDVGGMLHIPEAITTLLIGSIIFISAIYVLEKISGRGGG